MSDLMKRFVAPLSLLMLSLFQISVAQARSDELIQREIEEQIADSKQLAGARIVVHVEQKCGPQKWDSSVSVNPEVF